MKDIDNFCKEIGLSGKLLGGITSVVKTETDLSEFKLFLITKQFKTNLMMVNYYLANFDFENKYPFESFMNDYETNRTDALKNISRGFYSNIVLHKVDTLLSKGLTLSDIYYKIIDVKNANVIQVLSNFEDF